MLPRHGCCFSTIQVPYKHPGVQLGSIAYLQKKKILRTGNLGSRHGQLFFFRLVQLVTGGEVWKGGSRHQNDDLCICHYAFPPFIDLAACGNRRLCMEMKKAAYSAFRISGSS